MTKEKFEHFISEIKRLERLPEVSDGKLYNAFTRLKLAYSGKGYTWHSYYDEVLKDEEVPIEIFESTIRYKWICLCEWTIENGGKRPRANNQTKGTIEWKLGDFWMRVSRAKRGIGQIQWDEWYEDKLIEYGITEKL